MNSQKELLEKSLRVIGLLNSVCLCKEHLTEADKKEVKETMQALKKVLETYEK